MCRWNFGSTPRVLSLTSSRCFDQDPNHCKGAACLRVARLRTAGATAMERAGAPAEPAGLRGHRREPATADRDMLCVVLHGHGMRALEMVEWLQQPLCAALPSVEFLFLQAPVSWQTSSQQFLPAWLEYLGEFDGANEDDVCSEALAETTASLTEVIGSLGGGRGDSNPRVVLLGLSEGGCVALELAFRLPLAGVVTLVSHRLRQNSDAKLLCPWYALTASRDDVYHPTWANRQLIRGDAQSWHIVDDDHYLGDTSEEVVAFVRRAIAELRLVAEASR